MAPGRRRLAPAAAQALAQDRAAPAACVNALARNRGWRQVLVRGVAQVQAIALWYAVAHKLLRALSLRAEWVAQGEQGRRRAWGRLA